MAETKATPQLRCHTRAHTQVPHNGHPGGLGGSCLPALDLMALQAVLCPPRKSTSCLSSLH